MAENGISVSTVAASLAMMRTMPDHAAASAAAAQESAEAAAASAASAAAHGYGITVSGTTLTITEPTEGGE